MFKDAAKTNNGEPVKVAEGVEFYIAAASILEQEIAEASGDWQALLAGGGRPLPSGCGTHFFSNLSLSTNNAYTRAYLSFLELLLFINQQLLIT